MVHLNDVTPKEVIPGFFGKFLHGEKHTLAVWEIKAGSTLPEHQHFHEQITYILEGEMQMIIGGENVLLTSGTAYIIPSEIPHSAIAVTDCKIIDSFSPVRDAYK